MSEAHPAENPAGNFSREDQQAALFAQLVMQQANMAMMLLGKVAHPETGEVIKDVEAARLFIDQLEMLEAKTRGNLSKEEAGFLKQSLMSVRLAFVEAVDSKSEPAKPAAEKAPGPQPASDSPKVTPASGAGAEDEEHRKKFSKKY